MRDEILGHLRDEYLDDAGPELDENTPLISSGLIGHEQRDELRGFLEERYEITIPERDVTDRSFETVDAMMRLVRRIRAGEQGIETRR